MLRWLGSFMSRDRPPVSDSDAAVENDDKDAEMPEPNGETSSGSISIDDSEQEQQSKEIVTMPKITLERLHGFEDYLMFKVVQWARHRSGKGTDGAVWALLHLQIPGKGSRLFLNHEEKDANKREKWVVPAQQGIQSGVKYRTNMAMVTGVRFFGEAVAVKRALVNFQCNRGFLVSGWHQNGLPFQYRLGKMHVEPRAGDNMKEGCGEGIHMFRDHTSALGYGGYASHAKSSYKMPAISKRLSTQQGLLMCIETPAEEATLLQDTTHIRAPTLQERELPRNHEPPLLLDRTHGYHDLVANFVEERVRASISSRAAVEPVRA